MDLGPTKTPAFKREERRKRKERKKLEKLADSLCWWDPLCTGQSHPSDRASSQTPVLDTPWPCDPNPPSPNHASSEWAPLVPKCSSPKPTPSSPHGFIKDVQRSALDKCKSFFEIEEEENGDCSDEEGEGNERVLGFFSDLFRNDAGLRRFYEERRDKGVLVCLVCERKFGSSISLLHHANTISKSRRRQAHRAYGGTVSKVFGLETNQVPSLGCSKGEASDSGEQLAEVDSEEMEI
ncbi:hypothetical protein LUZ61_014320 [Rhynchospora tenuis]|uniref:C2H2-type domain-containing protein n=1 Tax=Rhynchospora tenuis TaxID=198213 RepID=A0AAD5WAT3_9POAL|nr:hypothetical protein LUZ61_014320 [Rhynchospora tenuis]